MPSRFCIGLTAALALSLAAAANGAITGTSLGSAPPPAVLDGCALTPFPLDPQPAGGAAVASVASPLGGVVGFSPGTDHRRVGAGWATWCHGYTGDVYFGAGLTSMTLTMPPATSGFVFYAVPNPFALFTFTVIGTTQTGQTAMVQGDASGLNGCAGFAFSTDDPCDPLVTIVITRLADFAVGEFSICRRECPAPPNTTGCCGAAPAFLATLAPDFTEVIAVATHDRPCLTDYVVHVIDLTDQSTAPIGPYPTGDSWATPFFNPPTQCPPLPPQHSTWTKGFLGTVYGVALDNAGNIYLAHSSVYGDPSTGVPITDTLGAGGAGAVYKIDTNTAVASVLVTLPNLPGPSIAGLPISESYPGLGNLAFDCERQVLYVTNEDDGRIYCITAAGTVLSTFDHATGTVAAGGAPEIGDAAGFVPRIERPWAVQPHNGRVYYSTWDSGPNPIWSVACLPSGAFVPGTQQQEAFSGVGFGGFHQPVSDITFSPSGCMIAAERSMTNDTVSGAHQSRLLEFCFDTVTQMWDPSPNLFDVGESTFGGTSCAGGVDFDFFNNRVFVTADAIHFVTGPLIYGLQGLPASGGDVDNSILIDLNQVASLDKYQIGSVEVSCVNVAPCLNVSHEKVNCQLSSTVPPVLTGCFTYTFDVTNKTEFPVKYITLPAAAISPTGATISPNIINLLLQDGSLLDPGETTTITLIICGAQSGDEVCFHISLQTEFFEECCFEVLCVELPECDCGQLSRQEFSNVVCNPDGTVNFTFEFNLENLSDFTVTDVFLIPFNDEDAVIVPEYIAVVLAPGGTIHLTVQITGATPGEEFCFFVVLKHFGKEGKECCCAITKCITVPECPDEQPLGCCEHPGAPCSMTTQADCLGVLWNPLAICNAAGICVVEVEPLGCCTHPDGTCSTTTQPGCDGTWSSTATCIVPGGCVSTLIQAGDLNGDGVVDSIDLGILLAGWSISPKDSACSGDRPCPVDLNQDGVVDSIDLGILLASWSL